MIVRLSGPDARPFCQGLLTQDVTLLAADRPLYAGLLSPQGKALFDLFLFADGANDGADVLLDVDSGRALLLVKRLAMFRLRRQVEITLDPAIAIFQQWGESGNDPRLAAAGNRFPAPAADQPKADATMADWHAHRLPLGLPASDEIGCDDLLWLETNARELNGVSFTKGCYTGQENTARMHHRDKLRKRLLPLHLLAPGPLSGPATGAVMAGERQVGELRGERHGGWQMALIRVDLVQGDTPLQAGGQAARLRWPAWLSATP